MSNPEPLQLFAVENVKAKAVGIGSQAPIPLAVSTEDIIKTIEKPPGNPALTKEQLEEKLPPEEVEKRQKVMLEYIRLAARYCLPHNNKSRWVTLADLPRGVADAKDMVAMCHLPRGKYSGIAALAHPQIDDKDPLRFFVLPNGMVVINPVITDHTKVPIFKTEGCMSFSDSDPKNMVSRYNKITVTYQTLVRKDEKSEPILSQPTTEELNGGPAHVFQHELGHLNGVSIYDADYSPEKSVGFGDGMLITSDIWEKENLKHNK